MAQSGQHARLPAYEVDVEGRVDGAHAGGGRRHTALERAQRGRQFDGTRETGTGSTESIVADLDGDREPEVLVRLFSGGAHCCEVTSIASFDAAGGAYRLTAKAFNDAGWVLRNVGGTPSPEFVSWGFRWAYWGGAYAGSPKPLQVWSFAGGAFTDVTRRFPAQLKRDQARQLSYVAEAHRQGVSPRGAFAAYVADGYSLGRPGAALARVRALDQAPGRARFLKALHNQLVRTGYTKPLPTTAAAAR